MKVIESTKSFNDFLNESDGKEIFVHPILSDWEKHPLNNSLSLVYARPIGTNEGVILSIDHIDSLSLPEFSLSRLKTMFTCDKKSLSQVIDVNGVIDLSVLYYLKNNETLYYQKHQTKSHFFFRTFRQENINRIVPLTKHFEMCENIYDTVKSVLEVDEEASDFYNQIVIPNLSEVERSGLKVNRRLFEKHFKSSKHLTHDDFIYTEYNIFTSTGRPSNRHGGVNFSALNKLDGSRRAFVSRFDNGFILAFDYDGYHLRLIGDIVGYSLPKESIHEYLGKQYFNTDSLSLEKYQDSKRLSFQYLYGGIPREVADKIPYFKVVNDFIRRSWDTAKSRGFIVSPLSKRKIYLDKVEEPNPQKLFNYLVQLLETERNMIVLSDILNFLSGFESKLILYTYDAFIFDLSPNDGREFLNGVQNILEQNGKFPIKKTIGRNYDEMVNVTERF